MNKDTRLQGIYAISDEILTPYEILPQCVESALKAGIKLFQLRDKSHSDSWLKPHALRLMELCEEYGALFILNDRLELAIELNAPGLHLGKDDGADKSAFSKARAHFGGILGVSSYGDVKQAQILESLGADYIAFGAFFASPTKPHARTIALETLQSARQILRAPICAIGGISTTNITLLKNADMHAVISALWGKNLANLQDSTLHSAPLESADTNSTLQQRLDSIFANAKALQNMVIKQ